MKVTAEEHQKQLEEEEMQASNNYETQKAISKFTANFRGVDLIRKNPHFGSSYAGWQDILNAANEPLAEQGIFFYFTTCDNRLTLNVGVDGGEIIQSSEELTMPPNVKNPPQARGQLYTYYKRYLFSAMFNICEAEDDDGNSLEAKPVKKIMATEDQINSIMTLKDALEYSPKEFKDKLYAHFKVRSTDKLDLRQATQCIKKLNDALKAKQKAA